MFLVGSHLTLVTLLVFPKKNTNTRIKLCQFFFQSLTLCKKFYEFCLLQKDNLKLNKIGLHDALPQFMLLYFTCSSFWQRPENDFFWPFKTCNVLRAEFYNLLSFRSFSSFQFNECARNFPPGIVRHCHDRSFANGVMPVQNIFNFNRRNVFSS